MEGASGISSHEYEEDALNALVGADDTNDDASERALLVRAQVYATLALVAAIRERSGE